MLDKEGFNDWADEYDRAVDKSINDETYPFCGYDKVHARVFELLKNAKSVLDLGVGTARLTKKLYDRGVSVTGLDFSENMLLCASQKMPNAELICHDLTSGLPKSLAGKKFDAVISLYAIHHLTDAQKAVVINESKSLLNAGGMFIIGDVSFNTKEQRAAAANAAGDEWDDEEYYTVAQELAPLIDGKVSFERISFCAGVTSIRF